VEPIVTYQSSVEDVKRCIKCKCVLSEDGACETCRISSNLKSVTFTRIVKTPSKLIS